MRTVAVLFLVSGFALFIQAFSTYAGHGTNFMYSLNQLLSDIFERPMIFYTIGLTFFFSLIFLSLSIVCWLYSFKDND